VSYVDKVKSGKCKNDNPGFFTNGLPAMKNPDALRIFFPNFCGGKYKPLKKTVSYVDKVKSVKNTEVSQMR
jgi:hypothetical protein